MLKLSIGNNEYYMDRNDNITLKGFHYLIITKTAFKKLYPPTARVTITDENEEELDIINLCDLF